jgi:hypothetical protein
MAYGHAERNLALIRQLEAETRKLLGSPDQHQAGPRRWLGFRCSRAFMIGQRANRLLMVPKSKASSSSV